MDMPKDDEVIRFVRLLNGKMVAVCEKRHAFPCDVVEVKAPHGDLIDRAQLLATGSRYCITLEKEGMLLEDIHGAKPVIGAEVK